MVIAVGRIMEENNLIGLRIFDTETKKTKDIRIEDEIKIKNLKSINKLGIVGDRQNDKPIIVIGYKDNKHLAVDINGNTKVLNSLDSYNTIDLLTNIEQYNKYIARYSLIGEQDFKFEVREDTDEVILTKYIENKEGFRVLNIPTFVTGIKIELNDDGKVINSPFDLVEQNLKVIYKGDKITSMKGMFNGYRGSNLDLSNFNTSNVTDMCDMFCFCDNLKELDLSNFDTGKVIDMHGMFRYCENLKELDISKFDTSKVTDMYGMFEWCTNLKNLDLSNFDTSQVADMRGMFYVCNKLEKLDISNFDTSEVTNMTYMFSRCSSLKELDLNNFDTSKVTDMHAMFESCKNLKELDLSNFDTSQVKYMRYMFYKCNNLEKLDMRNFNTSNVTDMRGMFESCKNIKELDLNNFDTSKVTDMHAMFESCKNLKELDLSNFDTSKVTDMKRIFNNTSLTPENTGLKVK